MGPEDRACPYWLIGEGCGSAFASKEVVVHVPEDERFGAIGLDGEELVLDWGVQKQSVPCPTVCVQPCRSEEDNSIDLFSIRTLCFPPVREEAVVVQRTQPLNPTLVKL